MSSFGRVFRVTTFGQSHSTAVGCIIEGVPSLLKIEENDVQYHLDRRRPGQSSITTTRKEGDKVKIISGTEKGVSLGTPISMMVMNEDMKKGDYASFRDIPRPGHADYTYLVKFGNQTESGGGRSSARETIGRVCAGAVAQQYLKEKINISFVSFVYSVGFIQIPRDVRDRAIREPPSQREVDAIGEICVFNCVREGEGGSNSLSQKEGVYYQSEFSGEFFDDKGNLVQVKDELKGEFLGDLQLVEKVVTRCPHVHTAVKIVVEIKKTQLLQDSIGGSVMGVISNLLPGLGEPCFDKVQAQLAHAMMSIPATKGFEIGSGFQGTKMKGSEHNDAFYEKQTIDNSEQNQNEIGNKDQKDSQIKTKQETKTTINKEDQKILGTQTNNSGGILGGITNGENIYFRVAFKPVSTIGKEQKTCNYQGEEQILQAKGRHDPCVLPRAPPIVDAMAAITIMDLYLLQTINIHAKQFVDIEI